MPVISNTILRATLPSGNAAVYEVEPHQLNRQHFVGPASDAPLDLNTIAIQHGRQLAHEKDGRWYKSGGWEEIVDLRTIALLERAASA